MPEQAQKNLSPQPKAHWPAFIFGIFITAVIFGGGVYAWQYFDGQEKNVTISQLQRKIQTFEAQLTVSTDLSSVEIEECIETMDQNKTTTANDEKIYSLGENGVRCSTDRDTIIALYPLLQNVLGDAENFQFCLTPFYADRGLLALNTNPNYDDEDYGTFYIRLVKADEAGAVETIYTKKLNLYEGCGLEYWSSKDQVTFECGSGDAGVVMKNVYFLDNIDAEPLVKEVRRSGYDFGGSGALVCNQWTEGDWCTPGEKYGDTGLVDWEWLVD